MLHKTRGIVISYVKFRETSIIAKIYTEKFGVQSYIENGVRSAKGKNKIALFQPLTVLDLVVYHDHKKDINRLSEIKCPQPFQTIPYDITKSSIGIFINEILNKSLKEHEENIPLFEFLVDSLYYLDQLEEFSQNFHLYFLIKYSFFLGFSPENAADIFNELLDIGIHISDETKVIFDDLIKFEFGKNIQISRIQRKQILDALLSFYRIHVEGFGVLKSLQVLKEVLD